MWRGWTLHSSAVVGVMLATLLPTPILATQAGTMGFDGVAAQRSSAGSAPGCHGAVAGVVGGGTPVPKETAMTDGVEDPER